MNPVVTPVKDDIVKYELTEEDLAYLKKIQLKIGDASLDDLVMHEMCIMQATAALTTEAAKRQRLEQACKEHGGVFDLYDMAMPTFTDHPICVSNEIAEALIDLNDRDDITPRQRASLKKIIPDILNTCPVKRTVKKFKAVPDRITERREHTAEYKAAEVKRKEILGRIVAPQLACRRNNWHAVKGTPFAQAVKIIREAAAVYYVDKEMSDEQNAQAGNHEPSSGTTGGTTQQA